MKQQTPYNLKQVAIALVVAEVLLWLVLLATFYFIIQAEPSFRFGRPLFAWGCVASVLLPMLILAIIRWKNNTLERFAHYPLLPTLIPQLAPNRTLIRFILFRIGFAFILVGLASPQYGIKEVEAKAEGIDIMVAVDVSNSMQAQDIAPNRITHARLAVEQIVNRLRGDRIGIITFAGAADVHLPMTTDYFAAKSFIKSIKTDFPVQGTAIADAVEMALQSFNLEVPGNKAIIIISDGENHEANALEAVKKAQEKGVFVYTMGVGTAAGGPVPEYQGDRQVGYKRNRQGETVISKLNQEMLQELAQNGNGIYAGFVNDPGAIASLMDALDQLEAAELESDVFLAYEDHFYVWLILGTIFVLASYVFPETDKRILV